MLDGRLILYPIKSFGGLFTLKEISVIFYWQKINHLILRRPKFEMKMNQKSLFTLSYCSTITISTQKGSYMRYLCYDLNLLCGLAMLFYREYCLQKKSTNEIKLSIITYTLLRSFEFSVSKIHHDKNSFTLRKKLFIKFYSCIFKKK